jgi:hypothetical protein
MLKLVLFSESSACTLCNLVGAMMPSIERVERVCDAPEVANSPTTKW